MTPCHYCLHDSTTHTSEHGCKHCQCTANWAEATRWTGNRNLTAVPLGPREYHRVWQDPTLPFDATTSCNGLSVTGRPRVIVGRCFLPINHAGNHRFTRYKPGSRQNSTTTDAELRKGAVMPKKLSTIENELLRIASEEEVLAIRKAELLAEKDARLSLPSEPSDDSIIKFMIQHDVNGITYAVVAFRSRRNGAQWYTTHNSFPGPYTWDALLDIMQKDVGVAVGGRSLEFFLFDMGGRWVR